MRPVVTEEPLARSPGQLGDDGGMARGSPRSRGRDYLALASVAPVGVFVLAFVAFSVIALLVQRAGRQDPDERARGSAVGCGARRGRRDPMRTPIEAMTVDELARLNGVGLPARPG